VNGTGSRRVCSGNDGDISALEVGLAGLERVPSVGDESVGGEVVGDLDLLSDSVSTCSGSLARVEWGIVNSLALATIVEGFASEPVVPPARLSLCAVRAEVASLSADVGAFEDTLLEAVLGSLLLIIGWDVSGSEELVDERLILADTITEHSSMVAVSVNAPLDIDDLAWLEGHNGCLSPGNSGSVVVDADTSVVAARTTATNWGGSDIRPSIDRLKDGAFGASILSSFKSEAGTARWNGKVTVSVYRGGEGERDKGG